MRGKRSKQYRKLMQQYAITFEFREPYQVLGQSLLHRSPLSNSLTDTSPVDAEIIQDAAKFKMDLVGGLERTLSGKVKPSSCSLLSCGGGKLDGEERR
jgi:U3 small nucleolar RNA-associated protein 23